VEGVTAPTAGQPAPGLADRLSALAAGLDRGAGRSKSAAALAKRNIAIMIRDILADAATPTAEDFDHAAEIMRLTAGEHPAIYARWVRADLPNATDAKVARLWKSASEGDRQFWAQVVTERREDRAELENQVARGDRLEGQNEDLRSLLDGVGVMAANAPEDGDSFGVLEQIAMRIAAVDVPDSTPLDVRPREGDPRMKDVTCGSCGEEFGTNADDDDIGCVECDARRCPHCKRWFGGQS
jgi:hypothetical protein